MSSTVAPYDSLLNPGQQVSRYTFVLGLAVNPHNGDLFIGDDPTFAILVNPPLAKGHIFIIPGGATVSRRPTASRTAAAPCPCRRPPSDRRRRRLYAYGLTAPKGGTTFVPSDDGGHIWAADHSQGLCRMDVVTPGARPARLQLGRVRRRRACSAPAARPRTTTRSCRAPPTSTTCTSPRTTTSAPASSASPSTRALTAAPATWSTAPPWSWLRTPAWTATRPTASPSDRASRARRRPASTPLYMGGLLDGFIRRINNPEDDPRVQTVDVVAMTTDQRAGVVGRGINGSIGMIGDDLYLPENQGFTVVKGISACPTAGQVCATIPLNIAQFGFIFGSAIGVDPDPQHLRSTAGLVYAAVSPAPPTAPSTSTTSPPTPPGSTRPAASCRRPASAEATVYCTTTCTRPVDPANPPGGTGAFRFAQGLMVADDGSVYLTEDAFAGARGGRGHAWVAPGDPYPPGATPVPLPIPPPRGAEPDAARSTSTSRR